MSKAAFQNPKRILCIVLGLCAASFFIMFRWGANNTATSGAVEEAFTITQCFYGVDAEEMERIAAIPLEDALSRLQGISRIVSTSENSRTRVSCFFKGKESGHYEAVREAAQKVYETLPSAAQRPELSSSGDSRVPVWTCAVTSGHNTGTLLEKAVKPALEGLSNIGEVEISGTGVTEMVITLNSGKAAASNIDAFDIAAALASNDLMLPGGALQKGDREIPVIIDARFSKEELSSALIPVTASGENAAGQVSGFVRLMDIAAIHERERNYESRSRLDGKEAALIAVMGSEGADLRKLSAQIQAELAKFPELEFTILSDRGETERKAYSSVVSAAVFGSLLVALLCAYICLRKSFDIKRPLICTLTVPVVLFFTAALLVALGFPLDKLIMAGMVVGVGAAVDAVILCAEYFHSCKTPQDGIKARENLRFPLVSGAVTTVIALVPLMIQKGQSINKVAWAIALVTLVAMFIALWLLPPLFLWGYSAETAGGKKNKQRKPLNLFFNFLNAASSRSFCRALAGLIHFIYKQPRLIAGFWLLLGVVGVASLCLNGASAEQESSEDSVYAQIEFDGGLHIEETDKYLAFFGSELRNHPGVTSVQTVARTGTGTALLSFDPNLMTAEEAGNLMRSTAVSGGFVYVMESGNDRIWRIKVSGDESRRCQSLAKEAAQVCARFGGIMETVLNFKDGSPRLNVLPDREKFAMNGASFSAAGQIARYGIHGPVAYKRIGENGESDVRILGGNEPRGKEEVLNILIKGQALPFTLGSVVETTSGVEAASIQRDNRRRCASLSIRTKAVDPRKVRDMVMGELSKIELPAGYKIEFDPDAIKEAEKVSAQSVLFVLALVFCYMILAAFKESFVFPFIVLCVVPPSLAVPAFCIALRGFPLNAVSAAAFVAVSGLAVNAAALVADAIQREKRGGLSCYRVFRRTLAVLASTTITTVACAVPFLFVKSNAALVVKTISLISALGVTVSAICAVTLIPALSAVMPGILWKKKNR
jgi:multidrug efflux pump subunit AcrB